MSTQNSSHSHRRHSSAAPVEVDRAAADGSRSVSPQATSPPPTLSRAVPVGPTAQSLSTLNFHQQGGSSLTTELLREDGHLSSDKGRHNKGKKGKRTCLKDRKKHKNSAARNDQAHYDRYHGSGNPSPSRNGMPRTTVEDVPAIQGRSEQALNVCSSRASPPSWRKDADAAAPCYSQGTETRLLLPALDGVKETADVFTDEAKMSAKWPRKRHKHDLRHKHGTKHKHKHREPHEIAQPPDANPESMRVYDAFEQEQERTSDSHQVGTIDLPTRRSTHSHKESNREIPLTSADAILKPSEALFPDPDDKNVLRKEERERRNRMLSRRSSMISRDFFLWGNDVGIEDLLHRQTAHLDQLAKISPEFSHLVLSRKYYLRSSRERSGTSPHLDSTSLSSRSERHVTPDTPYGQSPGTESLSDSKAQSPDDAWRSVLGRGTVSTVMLTDASAALAPLDSVALAKPRVGETGLGLADSGPPEVPAQVVAEKSKGELRMVDADVPKAADAVGAMSRGEHSGAEKNLGSYLSPPPVQTAVSVLGRKQCEDTFSFVPDWSDRKVSEQSDVSRTLPHTPLDSHGGKVVPALTYPIVVPADSKIAPVGDGGTNANADADSSSNGQRVLVPDSTAYLSSKTVPEDIVSTRTHDVVCQSGNSASAGAQAFIERPEKEPANFSYNAASQLKACGCIGFPCSRHAASFAEAERGQKAAHQSALSELEQAILTERTGRVLSYKETENALLSEGVVSRTSVDVFKKVEHDREKVPLKSTKEIRTRHHVRDSQSECPRASPSGRTYDPTSYVVTNYEIALTEQSREPAGDLVGYTDRKLVILELPDQRPEYEIVEESGSKVRPTLAASPERTNGATDALETEIKLMMGLPTNEAAVKADISMEDFQALSEGQERVPVDQEAPSSKERGRRKKAKSSEKRGTCQKAETIELHVRAPLVKTSPEHTADRQEVTKTTHEAPMSSPPNKQGKAPVRSPGSTNVPVLSLGAPAEAHPVTTPERPEQAVKRASLTIRTVPLQEKQHDAGEAASKSCFRDTRDEVARVSRSPSLAWRKKGRSFLRQSLDQVRDRTTSPTTPSTSLSPAAAMLPGKCRGSLDTATLYAVKPRGTMSRPHLWHELSAVMSRPVFVGISTPKLNGVVMLMDEDEFPAQLNHVLPAGSQVHLRELEISAVKH